MMYLVFGEQELWVNKMIDKLANSELTEIDDFNLVVFDGYKTPLHEVVNDASTLPFMADKKVVVIKNSYFWAIFRWTREIFRKSKWRC